MKEKLFTLVSVLFFFACNNNDVLKETEMKLKQCELEARENQVQKSEEADTVTTEKSKPQSKRKLRYVYAGSKGINGYFSDGSIVTCPHCPLSTITIDLIYNKKPVGYYQILSNGTLLSNIRGRNRSENPYYEGSYDTWVMTNYHWNVDLKDYD